MHRVALNSEIMEGSASIYASLHLTNISQDNFIIYVIILFKFIFRSILLIIIILCVDRPSWLLDGSDRLSKLSE